MIHDPVTLYHLSINLDSHMNIRRGTLLKYHYHVDSSEATW